MSTVSDLALCISEILTRNPALKDISAPGPPQTQPELARATSDILVATRKLVQLLNPIDFTLFDVAQGSIRSAAMKIAIRFHIAEIIRESDKDGVEVAEIASRANLDAHRLARVLRLLVNVGVFAEPKQNVFANNQFSLALDSKAIVQDLNARPELKYANNHGRPFLWLDFAADEASKAINLLDELVTNEPVRMPLQLHNPLDWPSGSRHRRAVWMPTAGTSPFMYPESSPFLAAVDWEKLEADSVVVGIGVQSKPAVEEVARAYPLLQYTVQDPADWRGLVANVGTVRLEVHDCLKPQFRKAVSVFMMNDITQVLARTPEHLVQVFRNLRDATKPEGSLLLGTVVWPGPIPTSLVANKLDPTTVDQGSFLLEWDLILIATWGHGIPTFDALNVLLQEGGWKVNSVYRSLSSYVVLKLV